MTEVPHSEVLTRQQSIECSANLLGMHRLVQSSGAGLLDSGVRLSVQCVGACSGLVL